MVISNLRIHITKLTRLCATLVAMQIPLMLTATAEQPLIVLEEFLPKGEIRPVHDPTVIQQDGMFYLYCTGGRSDLVKVLRSPDLLTWEPLAPAPEQIPDWIYERFGRSVRNLWAPDVIEIDDKYHMYYTASRFGTNDSAIGLTVSKSLDPSSPEYGWQDRGLVMESIRGEHDFNAIDPNVVFDQKGKLWMAFGSYWTGLKIVQLDEKTGLLADPLEPEIHSIASEPESPHALEGPSILWYDDWYYLFFSRGHCCQGVRSTYHIVVGRSRDITGPYVDRNGEDLMDGGGTLVLQGYFPVFGPGHNSVLKAMDREWLVHHFYDARKHWHHDIWGMPTLQVRPIVWDSEGWPLPGESWSGPAPDAEPENFPGKWYLSADFSDWQPADFRPDGTVETPRHSGVWELKGDALQFSWPDEEAPGGVWKDTLVLAPHGQSFVGRNQAGMIVRGRKSPAANDFKPETLAPSPQ